MGIVDFASLRQEYHSQPLDESSVNADPIRQFAAWFQQAVDSGIREPNAMALATASKDAAPSVRVVLMKAFDEAGLVFFTNYESRKGRELAANPRAEAVFYWRELERQVRISGMVAKLDRTGSEEYYRTRPRGAQIGAWASPQSQEIAGRADLEQRFAQVESKYRNADIPLPEHWGGYRLEPNGIEFWQGRSSRLHDRIHFAKDVDNLWRISRIAP